MKLTFKKRATSQTQKSDKRVQLLEVARKIFEKKDFNLVTMDEVAQQAKVAKGTLYLYFKTKEEICLELNAQDYQVWFDSLRAFLTQASQKYSKEDWVKWLLPSLRESKLFLPFLPLVPTLFEKNIKIEIAKKYKILLIENMKLTVPLLVKKYHFRNEVMGKFFLLQLHSLIVGLWSHEQQAPVIKTLFKEKTFDYLKINFDEALSYSVTQLLP